MDQWLVVIFRFLHIGAGVFWAGSIIYLAVFILPAVKAAGPEGGKFMQVLSATRSLPNVMNVLALTTIFSGLILMWHLSNGFDSYWMGSRFGIAVSTGMTTTIIGYLLGISINLPTIKKMAAMGKAIAASGAPPTPEQMEQIGAMRAKVGKVTVAIAHLLGITVIMMATARYL